MGNTDYLLPNIINKEWKKNILIYKMFQTKSTLLLLRYFEERQIMTKNNVCCVWLYTNV